MITFKPFSKSKDEYSPNLISLAGPASGAVDLHARSLFTVVAELLSYIIPTVLFLLQ